MKRIQSYYLKEFVFTSLTYIHFYEFTVDFYIDKSSIYEYNFSKFMIYEFIR